MKFIIPYIIFGMLLSACSLFDEEEEFPNCDQELLNKVEEEGSLIVWAYCDMSATPEYELSEEEVKEQREAISDMNQKFFEAIEHKYGEVIFNHSTFNSLASSVVTVKPPGLEYICQLDLVKSVRESYTFTTN